MGRLPTFVCPLAPHCLHVQSATSRFAGSPYERLQNRPSLEDKGQRADKMGAISFASQPSDSFIRPSFRLVVLILKALCTANCDAAVAAAAARGDPNDALCTPSVRPSTRVPSSSLTALASSFPAPRPLPALGCASGAIEKQEGRRSWYGRALPNAFGPYYTK